MTATFLYNLMILTWLSFITYLMIGIYSTPTNPYYVPTTYDNIEVLGRLIVRSALNNSMTVIDSNGIMTNGNMYITHNF